MLKRDVKLQLTNFYPNTSYLLTYSVYNKGVYANIEFGSIVRSFLCTNGLHLDSDDTIDNYLGSCR